MPANWTGFVTEAGSGGGVRLARGSRAHAGGWMGWIQGAGAAPCALGLKMRASGAASCFVRMCVDVFSIVMSEGNK